MRTVLVLDDDPTVLSLLGQYLSRSGYAVLLSLSVESAMEHFRFAGDAIELLIADVTLPVKSGVAVGIRLRSENQALRLIFTSGYPVEDWGAEDSKLVHDLPPESVRILLKPFSLMELIDSVDQLIGPPESDRDASSGR